MSICATCLQNIVFIKANKNNRNLTAHARPKVFWYKSYKSLELSKIIKTDLQDYIESPNQEQEWDNFLFQSHLTKNLATYRNHSCIFLVQCYKIGTSQIRNRKSGIITQLILNISFSENSLKMVGVRPLLIWNIFIAKIRKFLMCITTDLSVSKSFSKDDVLSFYAIPGHLLCKLYYSLCDCETSILVDNS